MKFKLKQPTKYMHQNLQEHSNVSSQIDEPAVKKQSLESQQKQQQNKVVYKNKKIIKKKHAPSAIRHNRINETFENIFNNSSQLFIDLNVNEKEIQQLLKVEQKHKCLCDKNVKYYCLKCMQKVCRNQFPSIELPVNIQIVHHQSQKLNKSSALPLKFLTKQVNFHYYSSNISKSNDKLWQALPKPSNQTYILFPHKNSKTIQEISQCLSKKQPIKEIKNIIILDCTWFQTDLLIEEMTAKGYSHFIRIQGYKSIYWRYNHHNDKALCSAEAITFFMRQYQKLQLQKSTKQSKQQIQQPKSQIQQSKSLIKQSKPLIKQSESLMQQSNQIKQKQVLVINNQVIKKYDNLLFLYCLNLKMIMKGQQIRLGSNNEKIVEKNEQK